MWNEQFEMLAPLNMELKELVLLSREIDLLLFGIVIEASVIGCNCFRGGSVVDIEVEEEVKTSDICFCWTLDAV